MRLYQLRAEQDLPIALEAAWAFFSDPRNLLEITPPELNLVPVGELPERMHPGQIIRYRVRLAPLLSVTWITEITHVEEGRSFVDEQRFGPYRFWHHRHSFEPIAGGTRCHDLIHYGLPGGPLAPLVNALSVRRQLDRIFAHRRSRLLERFGAVA